MRKRFKNGNLAIALPVLLAIDGVLMWRGEQPGSHRRTTLTDDLAQAWLFRQPRDYALTLLTILALASVIVVLTLFLRTMLDRVPMPFSSNRSDRNIEGGAA